MRDLIEPDVGLKIIPSCNIFKTHAQIAPKTGDICKEEPRFSADMSGRC